jgi:hypothetical protein
MEPQIILVCKTRRSISKRKTEWFLKALNPIEIILTAAEAVSLMERGTL